MFAQKDAKQHCDVAMFDCSLPTIMAINWNYQYNQVLVHHGIAWCLFGDKLQNFGTVRLPLLTGNQDKRVIISLVDFVVKLNQDFYRFRIMKFKTFYEFLRPCRAKFKTILNRYAIIKTQKIRLHMNNLTTILLCHKK